MSCTSYVYSTSPNTLSGQLLPLAIPPSSSNGAKSWSVSPIPATNNFILETIEVWPFSVATSSNISGSQLHILSMEHTSCRASLAQPTLGIDRAHQRRGRARSIPRVGYARLLHSSIMYKQALWQYKKLGLLVLSTLAPNQFKLHLHNYWLTLTKSSDNH